MARGIFWAVLLLSLAGLSGCGSLRTLAGAQNMDRRIRQDRIRHYEHLSDAYFLLGHDYYQLAKLAEEQKNTAKAKEAAQKAEIYLRMSHKAAAAVQEMRQEPEAKAEKTQTESDKGGAGKSKEETKSPALSAPPETETFPEPKYPDPVLRTPAPELNLPTS